MESGGGRTTISAHEIRSFPLLIYAAPRSRASAVSGVRYKESVRPDIEEHL